MQRRRRRLAARPGLAGLLGEHEVISVPGGSTGADLGAVRQGTTWCLPLVLGTDGVFNDDAAVPVRLLRELLQIEDVAVSSVRLVTVLAPARVPPDAPSGPAPALSPLAARYCLLTVDTRRAGDAVAARGGTPAAVAQILRRCAVHAEQAFATAGVPVGRLGVDDVHGLFPAWLGPAAGQEGRRADRTSESWGEVRVAGTVGTVFAVTGSGPDVLDRVGRLAAATAASVVGTALVLRRGGPAPRPANASTGRDPVGRVDTTLVLRVSRPDGADDTGTRPARSGCSPAPTTSCCSRSRASRRRCCRSPCPSASARQREHPRPLRGPRMSRRGLLGLELPADAAAAAPQSGSCSARAGRDPSRCGCSAAAARGSCSPRGPRRRSCSSCGPRPPARRCRS